jgi:hypothetical protein
MGSTKERSMGNNKDTNQKQPGEKEPGKFHYNPGNMSGKTAEGRKTRPGSPSQDRKAHENTPQQIEPARKGAGDKHKGGS